MSGRPTAADVATLRTQLGRTPFASILNVETRCPSGHPEVVRIHPIVDSGAGARPFPTLFWLTCSAVDAAIARIEAAGGIARAEAAIAEDEALRAAVAADHEAYAAERWSLLTPAERARWTAALRDRGIGGIADRTRVKCLHLHWAHHRARGSALGRWLEQHAIPPCRSR